MRSRLPQLLAVLVCVLMVVATPAASAKKKQDAGAGQAATTTTASAARTPVRRFSFAAAGDHGANPGTAAALRLLNRSDARFYLALGDLDYDETPSDRAWCRYVRDRLPRKGRRFPFQVLVGNHEQDGERDGHISNFARCLPDRMDSVDGPRSGYGAEYAFTYPRRNPLAKVIMISPNLSVDGVRHTYQDGSPHRRWLARQIRRARASGIRWVIVGMHYPCITTGNLHDCDAGTDILNFLVRRQVDLVLAGHNHIYERSKQLALNGASCRRIRRDQFDRDCVVPGWRDRVYRKDRGTVLVTAGSFGGREQGADPDDSERRYFAKVDGNAKGFVRYVVRPGRIVGRFIATGNSAADRFRIVRR